MPTGVVIALECVSRSRAGYRKRDAAGSMFELRSVFVGVLRERGDIVRVVDLNEKVHFLARARINSGERRRRRERDRNCV
jgi:hypothetical protein